MPPRDDTEMPREYTVRWDDGRQTTVQDGIRGRRANIGIIDEWTTHQDRHWIDDLLRNIHIEPTPEREVQEAQERVYEFAGWGETNPIVTRRADEATFTATNATFNTDLFRTLMGDWKLDMDALYVCPVDVEPEDVDPDEFEKILNGG